MNAKLDPGAVSEEVQVRADQVQDVAEVVHDGLDGVPGVRGG